MEWRAFFPLEADNSVLVEFLFAKASLQWLEPSVGSRLCGQQFVFVLRVHLFVDMGGSYPSALRVGWALLPTRAGVRGSGGRPFRQRCLRRHPVPRSCCFGTCCVNVSHYTDSLSELLDRKWMLTDPGAKINQISLVPDLYEQKENDLSALSFANNSFLSLGNNSTGQGGKSPYFYVVRDDLLHPLLNGNKARKLDAVMPILEEQYVTDVVTCGGCQSAHAAAVAVACAERRMRSHLLLRGEQPEIPTGYNLISLMYGDITYIPRPRYANRKEMLSAHACLVAGEGGSVFWLNDLLEKLSADQAARLMGPDNSAYVSTVGGTGESYRKVCIISEGAGDVLGVYGVVRLVKYLSQAHLFGKEHKITIVLDAGTGTTAVGLGIGATCLGLPWKIVAVMLADSTEMYKRRERCLISDFSEIYKYKYGHRLNNYDDGIIHWVERMHPRRFGDVRQGEVEICRRIARQTGILLDPVYTLAAWEQAVRLCLAEPGCGEIVVMLHTGGTLDMFGLAQRYKSHFHQA